MKNEEILTMEAGEEFDRLVATEVMGEPIPDFTPEYALELQLVGSPVKSPQGNWLSRCRYSEGDIPTWRPLPYSTDISAAWPVVEKMREEGYNLHIDYYSPKVVWAPKDRLTQVQFSNWQGIYQDDVRGDIAMPEAICKAALIAKYSTKKT